MDRFFVLHMYHFIHTKISAAQRKKPRANAFKITRHDTRAKEMRAISILSLVFLVFSRRTFVRAVVEIETGVTSDGIFGWSASVGVLFDDFICDVINPLLVPEDRFLGCGGTFAVNPDGIGFAEKGQFVPGTRTIETERRAESTKSGFVWEEVSLIEGEQVSTPVRRTAATTSSDSDNNGNDDLPPPGEDIDPQSFDEKESAESDATRPTEAERGAEQTQYEYAGALPITNWNYVDSDNSAATDGGTTSGENMHENRNNPKPSSSSDSQTTTRREDESYNYDQTEEEEEEDQEEEKEDQRQQEQPEEKQKESSNDEPLEIIWQAL